MAAAVAGISAACNEVKRVALLNLARVVVLAHVEQKNAARQDH